VLALWSGCATALAVGSLALAALVLTSRIWRRSLSCWVSSDALLRRRVRARRERLADGARRRRVARDRRAAGGAPWRTHVRIDALCDFVTVYDAGLWRGTVDPIYVPLCENAVRGHGERVPGREVAHQQPPPRERRSRLGAAARDCGLGDPEEARRLSAARLGVVPSVERLAALAPREARAARYLATAYGALFFGSLPVLGVLLASRSGTGSVADGGDDDAPPRRAT